MTADLFGERFIGMRTPAWHKLGIILPDDQQVTASEAFEQANLNFKYHTLPIGVTLPDGTQVAIGTDKAVYREPTPDSPQWKSLGVVSKDYEVLQNESLARGLDAISSKTGWKFETAGALGSGETIFVCLKTGTHSISGDEVDSYFLVSDGKAGNRALQISVTPVRVVCQNTLIMSDTDSELMITVPHTNGVEQEYTFWLEMISQLQRSQETVFENLRRLADKKITDDIAKRIFLDAFPEPIANQKVRLSRNIETMTIEDSVRQDAKGALSSAIQAYEYNMAQSIKWRDGAFTLYERFNDGAEQGGQMSPAALESLRGTAYAAVQAVAEICDWGGMNRDSVASSTLFGGRANQKARSWYSAMKVLAEG